MYTTFCVILEILIPYLTASIIDKGIAVGDMGHVARIGALMAVMAVLAMFCGVRAGVHSARASTGLASNLRESMFARIQDYSFSNIDKFSTAGLVTRLTTDVTNIQNAFQMLLMICTRSTRIVASPAARWYCRRDRIWNILRVSPSSREPCRTSR